MFFISVLVVCLGGFVYICYVGLPIFFYGRLLFLARYGGGIPTHTKNLLKRGRKIFLIFQRPILTTMLCVYFSFVCRFYLMVRVVVGIKVG